MGMGIGINTQRPDAGPNHRQQEEIACGIWFTSRGEILPQKLKFQNQEGEIQCIDNIRVITKEKKYYCGIPTFVYFCSTRLQDREYLFYLYYYPEHCKWTLSWNG